MGLDGRSRNEDGRIRAKRSDSEVRSLKRDYPELAKYGDDTTLGDLERRFGADSLDQVLRAVRDQR